jgi:hypothetical protein
VLALFLKALGQFLAGLASVRQLAGAQLALKDGPCDYLIKWGGAELQVTAGK